MDIDDFACFSTAHLDKVHLFTKNESYSSYVDDHSSPFDRLPDELLTRIFCYFPPVNMDNFATFLDLEVVSKRFHRCVADNRKILGNMSELVIGIHPDFPDGQYLCHIAPATMIPFLRHVKKITKVVVVQNWFCYEMAESEYLPEIDHYFGKMKLRELVLYEYLEDIERVWVTNLINNNNRFLETVQIYITSDDILADTPHGISQVLVKCSNMKNLRIFFKDSKRQAYWRIYVDFENFVNGLKSVEVLEINGYLPWMISDVKSAPLPALHTICFKHPPITSFYSMHPHDNQTLPHLKAFIDHHPLVSSVTELEIHICPRYDNLHQLPGLFDHVSNPIHLKIIFLPYLKRRKALMIVAFLEYVGQCNVDDIKISIVLMHSHIDQERKLIFVYSLLELFDVPYWPDDEIVAWEFFRGKVHVSLKLEMITDESLICHTYHHKLNQ